MADPIPDGLPELAERIRRLDPRPFPLFGVYVIEDGVVARQVPVYRLPTLSIDGPENMGAVVASTVTPVPQ